MVNLLASSVLHNHQSLKTDEIKVSMKHVCLLICLFLTCHLSLDITKFARGQTIRGTSKAMIDTERNNLRGLLDEVLATELLSKCLSWGQTFGCGRGNGHCDLRICHQLRPVVRRRCSYESQG